jgi:GDPmannose 4,6-dehydratase
MIVTDAPIVIFGAAGQDGRYLRAAHRRRGDRVLSFSRTASDEVAHLDVGDRAAVTEVIASERPRVVYQLAAASTTRHEALWDNQSAIVNGTLNVLEAIWSHCRETTVVVAGSALQFRNRGEAIHENDPFEADSAYSLARIQATHAARYYRGRGVRAHVAYLFHHDSPWRRPPHVSARICQDVAAIARGTGTDVEVGDLSVEKEWGYAGDVAEALVTLAAQSEVFEAVVGTGEAHSIGEWVERCFFHAGIPSAGRIRTREGFRAEYGRLVSNPETVRRLGWSPRVSFDELAGAMMRQALGREAGIP